MFEVSLKMEREHFFFVLILNKIFLSTNHISQDKPKSGRKNSKIPKLLEIVAYRMAV